MLDAGITPIVREYGSLGCSATSPRCRVALAALGEGGCATPQARKGCRRRPRRGIAPLVLEEKEGLALINGTDGMLGMLLLALDDLGTLSTHADIAAALSSRPSSDRCRLRRRPHGAAAAARSGGVGGAPARAPRGIGDHGEPRDPALCTRAGRLLAALLAAGAGAARDTVDHAALVASRELASAVDNPVVTSDGRVESNGNFHGAPVAYVLDFLAIAVADVASISERRTDRALDRTRSNGLPPFLADEVGVDSAS
jgi:histidine ammonia-lyase